MSYTTMHQSRNDPALYARIVACTADEGAANPDQAAAELVWPVVTAADIAAAYESALAADNPNPGGDPAVITDQMILSAVQANLPTS